MEIGTSQLTTTFRLHYNGNAASLDVDLDLGFDVFCCQVYSLLPVDPDSLILIDCNGCALMDSESLEEMVTCNGADIWCLDQNEYTLNCCTSLFRDEASESPSSDTTSTCFKAIQPGFCVVDTEFEICHHCVSFFDPSILRPLAANFDGLPYFSCRAKEALEFGLGSFAPQDLQRTADQPLNIDRPIANTAPPPQLFMQRRLLLSAIRRQFFRDVSLVGADPVFLGNSGRQLDFSRYAAASVDTVMYTPAEQHMLSRILSGIQTVSVFEEESQQQAARAVVDFEKVKFYADKHIRNLREVRPVAPDEALLAGLLAWFKLDFFKWCNKPGCSNRQCGSPGGKMTPMGGSAPTPEEKTSGWAGRVELYQCPECKTMTRFPRYNNPAYLLQHSRRGRCGEWANAFALVCRSLNLDTRYVLDFTDHVWVEVYLPSLQRFVHADPCENSCDNPLCYEKGWNKKLTYLLSFSRYGVTDSTPRYSRKLYEVINRRTTQVIDKTDPHGDAGGGCREGVFQLLLSKQNAQVLERYKARHQSQVEMFPNSQEFDHNSPTEFYNALRAGRSRFEELGDRRLCRDISVAEVMSRCRRLERELESLSLQSRYDCKSGEMHGRTSGDLAWRQNRGEVGKLPSERKVSWEQGFAVPLEVQNKLEFAARKNWGKNFVDISAANAGVLGSRGGINYVGFESDQLRLLSLSEWNQFMRHVMQTESHCEQTAVINVNGCFAFNLVKKEFDDELGECECKPFAYTRNGGENPLCSDVMLLSELSADSDDATHCRMNENAGNEIVKICLNSTDSTVSSTCTVAPLSREVISISATCCQTRSRFWFANATPSVAVAAVAADSGEKWKKLIIPGAVGRIPTSVGNSLSDVLEAPGTTCSSSFQDRCVGFRQFQLPVTSDGESQIISRTFISKEPHHHHRPRILGGCVELQYLLSRGGRHADSSDFDTSLFLWSFLDMLAAQLTTDEGRLGEISCSLWSITRVSRISIWSSRSQFVNGVQVRYCIPLGTLLKDGSPPLFVSSPVFSSHCNNPSEYILDLSTSDPNDVDVFAEVTSVDVFGGALVDCVRIVADGTNCANNDRYSLRAGGEGGSSPGPVVVPLEWRFLGFHGATGGDLHNLGVILCRCSDPDGITLPPPKTLTVASVNSETPLNGLSWRRPCVGALLPRLLGLIHEHLTSKDIYLINYITVSSNESMRRNNDVGALIRCILELEELNSKDVTRLCLQGIVRYLDNIVKNPKDSRNLVIRLSNTYFSSNILSAIGGLSLFCFGPAAYQVVTDTASTEAALQFLQCTLPVVIEGPPATNYQAHFTNQIELKMVDWTKYLTAYRNFLSNVVTVLS